MIDKFIEIGFRYTNRIEYYGDCKYYNYSYSPEYFKNNYYILKHIIFDNGSKVEYKLLVFNDRNGINNKIFHLDESLNKKEIQDNISRLFSKEIRDIKLSKILD